MSQEDYVRDQAIDELHAEEVMKRATMAQCIYLFVEGKSEEQALPILLEAAGIDLQELGIVIANYNGSGNLKHALRLLSQTLSHDRPIVLTLDNDLEGKQFCDSPAARDIDTNLVTICLIPDRPVVEYSQVHKGGSFEEAFDPNHFIETCFLEGIMHDDLVSLRTDFENDFNLAAPWLSQVVQFCQNHGYEQFRSSKPTLAVALAEGAKAIPETFLRLAAVLKNVRQRNPVKHPNDVELPKIRGLTC